MKLQPGDIVAVAPGIIATGCLGNQPIIAKISKVLDGEVRVIYNSFGDNTVVPIGKCKFRSGFRTKFVQSKKA